MKGQEFIRLASKLAAMGSRDEASCRSAVSRAYYGAFHAARDLLADLGFPVPFSPSAHVFIQRRLIGAGQADAHAVGSMLADLHRARLRADYDLNDVPAGTIQFAQSCVETAHSLDAIVVVCRQPPIFAEIQAGIAAYERKIGG
ncbi:MAG TPA: hypothetical protein VND64_06450 [Pirellulales bacterium]|nr:hypothetical protein [Pirellulales bacterium]